MEVSLIQALSTAQSWEIAKVLDSITGTIWPHPRTTYTGHGWELVITLNNSRITAMSYQRLGEEAVQVQEAASPRVQYA